MGWLSSFENIFLVSVQFSSVTQSCLTLCNTMNCSTPSLPVHHQLRESTQNHVHWVGDAIHHLILCCPLLLLPSIFPSIRVFSNEPALRIRWPNYWSFSLNISSSNEHPGQISFRMDSLDLLGLLYVGCPCSPRGSQESSPAPQLDPFRVSMFCHPLKPKPSLKGYTSPWVYLFLFISLLFLCTQICIKIVHLLFSSSFFR